MRRTSSALIFSLMFMLSALIHVAYAAPVRVVASTLDMADFARQIGGERVEVHAITKGTYDLHFYKPRPSEVIKLKKADLLIVVGMELDAFIPGLIDASRNPKIRFGAPGFVDPSKGVKARDVPTERIDGRQGDVHPYGNPHFWFTPENVCLACENIATGLIRVDPDGREEYLRRKAEYQEQVDNKFADWRKRLQPFAGTPVLQYHPSWNYFCGTFGLEIAGSIESKPGIPPSAAHLAKLVRTIRNRGIKLALVEPYYSDRPLRFLRTRTNLEVLRLPMLLGGEGRITTYLENMEHIVARIETALKK